MTNQPTPETTAQSPTSDKDTQGRFATGNRGGPGNPFARQVAALRKSLLDTVTPEDIAAITQALVEQAKKGNVQAAKLLLGYLIGKPAPATDPDRLDVNEWQQFKDESTMVLDLKSLVATPEPRLPLTLVRTTRPEVTDTLQHRLHHDLTHADEYYAKRDGRRRPSPNGKKEGKAASAAPASPSANGHASRLPPELIDAATVSLCQVGPSANGKSRLG